jgi:hypothetical protein
VRGTETATWRTREPPRTQPQLPPASVHQARGIQNLNRSAAGALEVAAFSADAAAGCSNMGRDVSKNGAAFAGPPGTTRRCRAPGA